MRTLCVQLGETGRRTVDPGPAAIDEQRAAADIARGIRGEIGNGGRNLVGAAPAVEYGVAGVEIVDVGPLLERAGQRGLGDARRDRVDANAGAADLGGKALHEEAD